MGYENTTNKHDSPNDAATDVERASDEKRRTWSQAQLLHDMLHHHPTWPFGTSELTNTDDLDVWDAPDPDDGCVGPDDPGIGPWIHEFDD
jgi:hypothetical protein